MAGIPTLNDQDIPLLGLRRFWRFLLGRLKSDPNGASYVASAQAFGPVWSVAHQQEMDLEDAVTDAEAAVVAADKQLDKLADLVDAAIRALKNPALEEALHDLFFGSETVSEFRRPLLAKELEGAQGWPTALAQAKPPALVALAPQATIVLETANTAATALDTASKARASFRLGGQRKQTFDAFNSLAATIHGGLKAFVHDHPELALPVTHADSFFLHVGKSPHGKTVSATAGAAARAEKKASETKAKHDAAVASAAAKVAASALRKQQQADAKAKKKLADEAVKTAKAAAKAAAEALKKPKK